MSENLELRARDRVLVFAPHPDDESIATGGLLQVALAAGAVCRVVVVTDGDNNPWPQRWIEKRWRIDAAARARWGARRRDEARAALRVLGVAIDDARFLGFPDMGLTDLLMRGDRALITALTQAFADFAPTHVVLPSLGDRHPDHSALHVLLRLLLAGAAGQVKWLAFGVHGDYARTHTLELALTPAQRDIKAQAIRCHLSQMRLSEKRFVAHARASETFDDVSGHVLVSAEHPLRAHIVDDALELHIDTQCWGGQVRGCARVVLDGSERCARVQFDLDKGTAHDASGTAVVARIRRDGNHDIVTIACPGLGRVSQGFVKIGRCAAGFLVFDRFGWQAVETER